jgi:hypothetical protein
MLMHAPQTSTLHVHRLAPCMHTAGPGTRKAFIGETRLTVEVIGRIFSPTYPGRDSGESAAEQKEMNCGKCPSGGQSTSSFGAASHFAAWQCDAV